MIAAVIHRAEKCVCVVTWAEFVAGIVRSDRWYAITDAEARPDNHGGMKLGEKVKVGGRKRVKPPAGWSGPG